MPRLRRNLSILVASALVGLLLGWLWVTQSARRGSAPATVRSEPARPQEPVSERPLPRSSDYAGSAACAACHREIVESYRSHPMSRSLAQVLNASPLEDYAENAGFSRPESRKYLVEKKDGHVFHHEIMTDAAGDVIYDQAVEVQYAMGSGIRGRSYLIDREGMLFISPISWYSQRSVWDLSPGYVPARHTRFERRATAGCLVCHSGRLAVIPADPDRYDSPPFLEEAIGCERCHGPARRHAELHQSKLALEDDPIVNPSRLDAHRQESVCAQCHLQGQQRVLRYGRTAHDFRPGDALDDIWTVFLSGPGVVEDDATRAVSQFEQMHASACFRGSKGKLNCTSCHDPHSAPESSARAGFFDARCLSCHRERGCSALPAERAAAPANGSCIHCHMPRLRATDIPHTAQTDHRVLRSATLPPHAEPLQQYAFFGESESPLSRTDVSRARGLMLGEHFAQRPDAQMLQAIDQFLAPAAAARPDDVPVLFTLGKVRMHQGRPEEAEELWSKALQIAPNHEPTLMHLAMFYNERGDAARGLELMRRFEGVNPWQAAFQGRLAQAEGQQRHWSTAIAAAERGLELNPSLVPLRRWLIEMYRQVGRHDDADRQQQILDRMEDR